MILIIKIGNAVSNDKEECANQCAHAVKDALEDTCKMKGHDVRSMNRASVDVDDCGALSASEGVTLDDDSCDFLDTELSDAKFEKVRKLMSKGKQAKSSKRVMRKNMSTSLREVLKTKWIEKRKNSDGIEH